MRYDNIIDRFMAKVSKESNGCWRFMSNAGKNGYGRFRYYGHCWGAHRVSYLIFVGDIPRGFHIHHICENKTCVNPAHLEPLDPDTHISDRSPNAPAYKNARKTHCPQGHAYEGNNFIYKGSRICRTCHLAKLKARTARREQREAHITGGKRGRLSESRVRVIKQLLLDGSRKRCIAHVYGVSTAAIQEIAEGANWKWVQ